MIESAGTSGVATTTTLRFGNEDVTLTLTGIPAVHGLYGEDQDFIDGPLAERIEDAALALLAIVREAREATASVAAGGPGKGKTDYRAQGAGRRAHRARLCAVGQVLLFHGWAAQPLMPVMTMPRTK